MTRMSARGPQTTPSAATSADFTKGPIRRANELEAEIVALASNIHSAEAQLATRLAELDELGGWSGDGFRNMRIGSRSAPDSRWAMPTSAAASPTAWTSAPA
jgi:hypothetical protein